MLHNDKKALIRAVINKFASKNKTVIDIGCAIGKWLPVLSPAFKKVIALDISAKNLDVAEQLYPQYKEFGDLFPGVEVCATAYLNLARGDGFTEIPLPTQGVIVLLAGLALGTLMVQFKPWPAAGLSLLALPICFAAALQVAEQRLWFGWPVIALVQIPAALAWSVGARVVRLKFEKDVLARTLEETTKLVEATKATAQQRPAQLIPDHTLLKRVGRGAYGEVWLARNAIAAFHAVKITRRAGFPGDRFPAFPDALDDLMAAAYGTTVAPAQLADYEDLLGDASLDDAARYDTICASVLTALEFVAQ